MRGVCVRACAHARGLMVEEIKHGENQGIGVNIK